MTNADARRPAEERPPQRPNRATKRAQRRARPLPVPDGHFTELDTAIRQARQTLSFVVEAEAGRTAAEIGFGWAPDSAAPDRDDVLRAAYEHSAGTGEALPVSDLFCESTIYTDPKTNMAFRFWHDVSHVRQGLSFGLVDELELAIWHLHQLEQHGHGPGTVTWDLLRADLIGQIYVMGLVQRFPLVQDRFVLDCVRRGLDAGVLAECRLIVPVAGTSNGQESSSISAELAGR